MKIDYSKVKSIDGDIIYELFEKVGWIAPKKMKPIRHVKIDGICNHTVYLDSKDESEFLKLTFENSASIYIAKFEDRIVGFVRVLSDLHQRSFIYDLVVDPEFQKKSIGKNLVKRCISEYSNTQITLGTATATMSFYEKLGFEKSENYMEMATEAY